MDENWMTIEQAAVALGVSVRTVNRHINAGKLQSRLAEGRREVLLDAAAPTAASAAAAGGATYASFGASDDSAHPASLAHADTHAVDYETVLALADNAADKAELAVSAYQALARNADERIRVNRRISFAAWSLVGVFAVGAVLSVGWASHTITRAAVETRHLQEQVSTAAAAADGIHDECDDLRRALAEAREHAARNEGQLAAYREPRPTAADTATATATHAADADGTHRVDLYRGVSGRRQERQSTPAPPLHTARRGRGVSPHRSTRGTRPPARPSESKRTPHF